MPTSIRSEVEEANKKAIGRVLEAQAVLVDMKPAIKAIPGYKSDLFTHAGPPIEWERMCYAQRKAITNLIMYEGFADTPEEADRAVRSGRVHVKPNHDYGNVSGMCGATSASMPVLVIRDEVHNNTATCWQQTDMTSFAQNYEIGRKEVEFVTNTLAPVLAAAIKLVKGINVKEILVKGLQMGDELHGLLDASRGVFLNQLLPYIVRTDFSKETLVQEAIQ